VATATPASYEIEVSLDETSHRLHGHERLEWSNTTDTPTSELWFHLYLNAFAHRHTTFMRELGSGTLRGWREIDMEWGWIQITGITVDPDIDSMDRLEFVRPDDGNSDDFSVIRLSLADELGPGQSIRLEIDFEAQLPRILARTGFSGDFHMVGQWFPKLGVFEATDGGEASWNCHQFHANSEFYADFASYRVDMTVPEGWIVGATGSELIDESVTVDGTTRRRVTYQAQRVHDFAWCAAPPDQMELVEGDFDPLEHVPSEWLERAVTRLQLSAAELELPPMRVRVILPVSQHDLGERMLRAARLAIAWFGLHYGPYPYPQLTVVSPPPGADEAGGMEYPTLITTGTSAITGTILGRWTSGPESVTIHEFGHQYFQGQLASNEFEQPWLDEGFTSYAETECLEAVAADRLAPEIAFGGFWGMERLSLAVLPEPVTIDRPAWEFRRRWDYFRASYSKTAVVLKTLEGLVGRDSFARAMRAYVERFRFAHPSGGDFEATMEEQTGQDLSWFFEQAVHGDARPDWAVLSVSHRRTGEAEGFEWTGEGWQARGDGGADESTNEPWQIEVDIGRKADFRGPVAVRLVFADGRREERRWDGQARWVRLTMESEDELEEVIVDPNGVWALETERADNYWRAHGQARRRAGWWLVAVLRGLSLTVLPWS